MGVGNRRFDAEQRGDMIIEPPAAKRRWPLVVVSVLTVALVAGALGLWLFDRSLDRVPVEGLAENDEPSEGEAEANEVEAATLGRATHVLVAGSDDRSVLTPEERREFSTGDADGERTEALMLLRIDPDLERIDALRFPRDLLVTRCDGSRGRINAAYAIGERDYRDGPSCLVSTITRFTGLPIHHVVKVDFRGFVDAVEAVGGVEVRLEEPIRDRRAGIDLPAGCVELDGADALGFVRARQIDNDFERIGRQQQLLAAVLDQVATPSTLADPRRVAALITTAQRSLELDEGLTAGQLRSLAGEVADLGSDDLVTRTVTGEPHRSNGSAFLEPDEEYAAMLFTAFERGDLPDTPEEPPATAADAERDGVDEADGDGRDDADQTRGRALDGTVTSPDDDREADAAPAGC
jgi:LCP family protein required for cell wall assembly